MTREDETNYFKLQEFCHDVALHLRTRYQDYWTQARLDEKAVFLDSFLTEQKHVPLETYRTRGPVP